MRLKNNTTNQEITLPNDLLWVDETWSPVTSNTTYTITGALVIEYGQKQAGSPRSQTARVEPSCMHVHMQDHDHDPINVHIR